MIRCGAAVVGALAITACGSSSTAPHPRPPGIAFVAGNGQTDTIGAMLATQLEIQVTGAAGAPVSGQAVQFVSVLDSAQTSFEVLVAPAGSYQPGRFAAETLDANGRASAMITMGTKAGPARLVVTIPASKFVDTARFTVTPGAAVSLVTTPQDTLVFVGANLTVSSAVRDRRGNLRPDSVTLVVDSGSALLVGRTVTATAVGRNRLVSTSLKLADTTHLTAVPQGVLAAVTDSGIGVFKLDGTGFKLIHINSYIGVMKWAPSGKSLVFDQTVGCPGTQTGQPLKMTDLQGNITTVASGSGYDEYPSYSRDGAWIYYSSTNDTTASLWRTHPDGSNNDSLTTTNPSVDLSPSPSPDGQRVAYVAVDQAGNSDLRVLTVSTGAVTDLGINGVSPEWAPSGNRIAYIKGNGFCVGQIAIVNADGSGAHTLTAGSYYPKFDWSPDGQWLIADHDPDIDLINTTTGLALPLNYSFVTLSPAWMP